MVVTDSYGKIEPICFLVVFIYDFKITRFISILILIELCIHPSDNSINNVLKDEFIKSLEYTYRFNYNLYMCV